MFRSLARSRLASHPCELLGKLALPDSSVVSRAVSGSLGTGNEPWRG